MKGTTTIVELTIAVALAAAPVAAGTGDGTMRFKNSTQQDVVVRILHSNDDLQKKRTVAKGETESFKFSGQNKCKDKNRKFEIKPAE